MILTNKYIEKRYYEISGNKEVAHFEYITTGLKDVDESDYADYEMVFDMTSLETQEWVVNKKDVYDDIILNTCPFAYILDLYNVYGMYELLKDGGKMYMMAVTRKKDVMISEMLKRMIGDRIENVEYYFKNINGIIFQKRGLYEGNMKLWAVNFCKIINKLYNQKSYSSMFDMMPLYVRKLYVSAAEYVIATGDGNRRIAGIIKRVLDRS